MRQTFFVPRIVALFLSISVALPSPAYAMRPQRVGLEEIRSRLIGLEEVSETDVEEILKILQRIAEGSHTPEGSKPEEILSLGWSPTAFWVELKPRGESPRRPRTVELNLKVPPTMASAMNAKFLMQVRLKPELVRGAEYLQELRVMLRRLSSLSEEIQRGVVLSQLKEVPYGKIIVAPILRWNRIEGLQIRARSLDVSSGLEELEKAASILRQHGLVRPADADATAVVQAFLVELERLDTVSGPPLSAELLTKLTGGRPYSPGRFHRGEIPAPLDQQLLEGWLKSARRVLIHAGAQLKLDSESSLKKLGWEQVEALERSLYNARSADGMLLMGDVPATALVRWFYRHIPQLLVPHVADPSLPREELDQSLRDPFRLTNDRGNDEAIAIMGQLKGQLVNGVVLTDDPEALQNNPALVKPWLYLEMAFNLVDYARDVVDEVTSGDFAQNIIAAAGTSFLWEQSQRDLDRFVQEVLQARPRPGRPYVVEVLLPDNNAQLAATLKLVEVKLSANPDLKVILVPKRDNGVMNDASEKDARGQLERHPDFYKELLQYEKAGRFQILAGPASHGFPLNLISEEVGEALLKADAIYSTGDANLLGVNGLNHPHLYLAQRLKFPFTNERMIGIKLDPNRLKEMGYPPLFLHIDGTRGLFFDNLFDQPGRPPHLTIRQHLGLPDTTGLEEDEEKVRQRLYDFLDNYQAIVQSTPDKEVSLRKALEISYLLLEQTGMALEVLANELRSGGRIDGYAPQALAQLVPFLFTIFAMGSDDVSDRVPLLKLEMEILEMLREKDHELKRISQDLYLSLQEILGKKELPQMTYPMYLRQLSSSQLVDETAHVLASIEERKTKESIRSRMAAPSLIDAAGKIIQRYKSGVLSSDHLITQNDGETLWGFLMQAWEADQTLASSTTGLEEGVQAGEPLDGPFQKLLVEMAPFPVPKNFLFRWGDVPAGADLNDGELVLDAKLARVGLEELQDPTRDRLETLIQFLTKVYSSIADALHQPIQAPPMERRIRDRLTRKEFGALSIATLVTVCLNGCGGGGALQTPGMPSDIPSTPRPGVGPYRRQDVVIQILDNYPEETLRFTEAELGILFDLLDKVPIDHLGGIQWIATRPGQLAPHPHAAGEARSGGIILYADPNSTATQGQRRFFSSHFPPTRKELFVPDYLLASVVGHEIGHHVHLQLPITERIRWQRLYYDALSEPAENPRIFNFVESHSVRDPRSYIEFGGVPHGSEDELEAYASVYGNWIESSPNILLEALRRVKNGRPILLNHLLFVSSRFVDSQRNTISFYGNTPFVTATGTGRLRTWPGRLSRSSDALFIESDGDEGFFRFILRLNLMDHGITSIDLLEDGGEIQERFDLGRDPHTGVPRVIPLPEKFRGAFQTAPLRSPRLTGLEEERSRAQAVLGLARDSQLPQKFDVWVQELTANTLDSQILRTLGQGYSQNPSRQDELRKKIDSDGEAALGLSKKDRYFISAQLLPRIFKGNISNRDLREATGFENGVLFLGYLTAKLWPESVLRTEQERHRTDEEKRQAQHRQQIEALARRYEELSSQVVEAEKTEELHEPFLRFLQEFRSSLEAVRGVDVDEFVQRVGQVEDGLRREDPGWWHELHELQTLLNERLFLPYANQWVFGFIVPGQHKILREIPIAWHRLNTQHGDLLLVVSSASGLKEATGFILPHRVIVLHSEVIREQQKEFQRFWKACLDFRRTGGTPSERKVYLDVIRAGAIPDRILDALPSSPVLGHWIIRQFIHEEFGHFVDREVWMEVEQNPQKLTVTGSGLQTFLNIHAFSDPSRVIMEIAAYLRQMILSDSEYDLIFTTLKIIQPIASEERGEYKAAAYFVQEQLYDRLDLKDSNRSPAHLFGRLLEMPPENVRLMAKEIMTQNLLLPTDGGDFPTLNENGELTTEPFAEEIDKLDQILGFTKPSAAGLEERRPRSNEDMLGAGRELVSALGWVKQVQPNRVIVIDPSSFEAVPGLKEAVEALQAAGLEKQVLVLPRNPTAEYLDNLVIRLLNIPDLIVTTYSHLKTQAIEQLHRKLKLFQIPVQEGALSRLSAIVRQILSHLGIPRKAITPEVTQQLIDRSRTLKTSV